MRDGYAWIGYGYATDEIDTNKFTKTELKLWMNLVDNEDFYDLLMDYDGQVNYDDPVYTEEITEKDYSFTYIPDQEVVNPTEPIKTYTKDEADKLLIEHTKSMLEIMLTEKLGKNKEKDKEIFDRTNAIINKIDIPHLAHYQTCIGY